ncbi:MAG: hypothetical protein LC798_11270 [Chloroflexi bacterium]|nr:hypothetical protein [Chloroflexota bacterium]
MTLLDHLRQEYAAEAAIPVSIHGLPLLHEVGEEVVDGRKRVTTLLVPERDDEHGPAGPALGRSLSSRIVRLLEHDYGLTFGVRRALGSVEGWCQRRHVKKGDPLHAEHPGTPPLCARLARYCIVTANSSGESTLPEQLRDNAHQRIIRRVAELEGIGPDDATLLLEAALRRMRDKLDEWVQAA